MKAVDQNISFAKLEEQVLSYWRDKKVFEQSIEPDAPVDASGKRSPRPKYVFYDGPPFATGLPHYGHLLAGTIKDVVGRFFTMKGYHVDRRFGWDCHGVPVEFEIQKKLDLHGAKAIREFGVGKFNEECRSIVLRYSEEWKKFVERSGRWVDFSREYRTMDRDFMESVWWVLKSLWDRGFLYEGVKNVPYSWAINTPLSNFEANLNYKVVQDPSITVRATFLDSLPESAGSLPAGKAVNAYVWTTTPWTVPSNMALAVHPELVYAVVDTPDEVVLLAEAKVGEYFPSLDESSESNEGITRLGSVTGSELLGLQYKPFFPYFEAERDKNAFRVYPGEFVTADEGTGIVHCASFGDEDLQLFLKHDISIVDPVDEDGNFDESIPDFAGMNIKSAEGKIISALRQSGVLALHKTIEHSYPFCWRTDTPLMYKSISTWFVKVEMIRDLIIENNSRINWVPDHLRDGRFGKWLENARDWAISRNRFWGTPIPIWVCASCDHKECLGSAEELEKRCDKKVDDLHNHFIDELTFPCEKCSGVMHRIPEVLDCWFESGSMPYAQEHYPFENKEEFEDNFPADFIAEGLDQTRGWFYTLLVLSSALFGRPAFRNVVVNGIVLAEDGRKMSKSLQNYPPPEEVMNEFGADAMRLYLLSSAATRAEDLRFTKKGVQDVVRQTLLPLWNAYNFFVTYALVDEWTLDDVPGKQSSNVLDRWILSKAASLAEGVDEALSSYHLYLAAPPILEFVDQLTNWYIRLNRRRFWAGNRSGEKEDKLHAYATLHKALLSFVRVLAPLAPFVSEEIFKNLSQGVPGLLPDSVHLNPFPGRADLALEEIDEELEQAMELFEEVILLGRGLRNDKGHKLRQPLAGMVVVYESEDALQKLKELDGYLRDELNVKDITYSAKEADYVELSARLNTKLLGKELGPKLGSKGMQQLRNRVESLSTDEILAIENGEPILFEGIAVDREGILIERKPLPGIDAAASSGRITIVLDTKLTQELRLEGLAREFVNRVQKLRKDFGFEVTDRVIVSYMTACPRLLSALEAHKDYIMEETLALELHEIASESEMKAAAEPAQCAAQEIEDKAIVVAMSRTQA